MARIVLVDDEPDVVFLVKKMLEKEGHEVTEFYNGKDALEQIEDISPELIILDIMMPGIDGWEVARTLKSRDSTKGIPIVILTVRVSEDSVEKSFEYAFADAHLGKPINTKKMLNTIDWILTNRR